MRRRSPAWSPSLQLSPLVMALAALWPIQGLTQAQAARPAMPPRDALPVPLPQWRTLGAGAVAPVVTPNPAGGREMLVQQSTQRAIYQWQSFDIGAASGVRFDMPDANSSALNRIPNSSSPSAIHGRLSSNGTVFLLNGNGVLFGPTARVDVRSLLTGTLNLSDNDFVSGLTSSIYSTQPTFTRDDAALGRPAVGPGFVEVQSGAQITTASGGRVFLFAEQVDNAGRIQTPGGQTVLAAGDQVFLQDPTREALYASEVNPSVPAVRGLLVEVAGAGRVNQGGEIVSARGNTTLVGLAVNQAGRISATTSVSENGSVFLLARSGAAGQQGATADSITKRATTGGTLTLAAASSIVVSPDIARGADGQPLAAQPTSSDNAGFTASRVELSGQTIELQQGSRITAPGATVRARAGTADYNPDPLTARNPGPVDSAARLVLGAGAVIDVAGTTDTQVSVARQFVTTELLGSNDLRDAPLQKSGPLARSRATFDLRLPVPILGDTGNYRRAIEQTVNERLASGGHVFLESTGAVLAHPTSRVDVSGGRVDFTSALVTPTVLLGEDGRRYSLNQAAADQRFVAIDGVDRYFTARDDEGVRNPLTDRWGLLPSFGASLAARREDGYVEGRAAGSVQVTAPLAQLDGALAGSVQTGARQRDGRDAVATSARFSLGSLVNGGNFGTAAFRGTGVETPLTLRAAPADADPALWADPLAAPLPGTSRVAASTLQAGGFGRITLASNASLTTDAAADLHLPDRAVLSLAAGFETNAGGLRVNGDVRSAGGSVSLLAVGPVDVGAGTRIDLSGNFANQRRDGNAVAVTATGGTVNVLGQGGVVLGEASVLDVSGGGVVAAGGAISGGAAGSISVSALPQPVLGAAAAVPLQLGGELRGHSLDGARGGSLTLRSTRVRIDGAAQSSAPLGSAEGLLTLGSDFFTLGGFERRTLDGVAALDVLPGTTLAPQVQTWLASPRLRSLPSGSSLGSLLTPQLTPAGSTRASTLTLQSSGLNNVLASGELTVGAGASIRLAAQSSLTLAAARSQRFEGRITAPAGTVVLEKTGFTSDALPDPYGVLWLGTGSRIDVSGALLPTLGSDVPRGTLLDAGRVSLRAPLVLWNEGARIVADGAQARLAGGPGSQPLFAEGPQTLFSNAGRLDIELRNELLSGGELIPGGGWLGGQFQARAAGPAAAGGQLDITLTGDGTALGAPTRELVLAPTLATGNFQHGDAAAAQALRGRATVDAAMVQGSGAAGLLLRSSDTLRLSGSTTLELAGRVVLDAPVLRGDEGSRTTLKAGSLSLGPSSSFAAQQSATAGTAGTARLDASAGTVDLLGRSRWAGFDRIDLASSGDLRFTGVVVGNDPLQGSLRSAADVTLTAAQVLPTTDSRFTVEARDLRIDSAMGTSAQNVAAPQSAGGMLTLQADRIVQAGVLRAPQGRIELRAATELDFAAGSETSVSGAGQALLYGSTTGGGSRWTLQGAADARVAAPDKRIDIDAPRVDLAASARLNMAGGGALLAHEFIAGPGGSQDVFAGAANGAFAVMPSERGVAPIDRAVAQEVDAAGQRVNLPFGQQITFGPGGPLPAGTYAVLPARYALLPGAFLVRPLPGLVASEGLVQTQPNGAVRVAARLGTADTTVQSSRPAVFLVTPSAVARQSSELRVSSADDFFAAAAAEAGRSAGRGPADAGTLNLATQQLSLAGRLDFAPGSGDGARGGELNLAAPQVLVSPQAPTATGVLWLTPGQLASSGAESVLIGGTRSAAVTGDGRAVDVRASSVTLDTAGQTLTLPDLTLVARERVTLATGASVAAGGSGSGEALLLSGDGASLRVNAGQAGVQRSAVVGTSGRLELGDGVQLLAGGGRIDAESSAGTRVADSARLQSASLGLGAASIQVGGALAAGDTGTLLLSGSLLAATNQTQNLLLRSYGPFGLTAGSVLGSPDLKLLSLDAPELRWLPGAGSQPLAAVTARQVTLANSGPAAAVPQAPPLPPADSRLLIQARDGDVTIGPGSVLARGAERVAIEALGDVVVQGRGGLTTTADLLVQSARVTGVSGAAGHLAAAHRLQLAPLAGANVGATQGLGASLQLQGRTVRQDGRIELPSGQLRLDATDGITFGSGSSTTVAGGQRVFDGVTVHTPGGGVQANTTGGNLLLAAGATLDAGASGDAPGGQVQLRAAGGTVLVQGSLRGSTADGAGAELALDSGYSPDLGALSSSLAGGGFSGAVTVRSRSGDLVLPAGATFSAGRLGLQADGGGLDLRGQLLASGTDSAGVTLAARDNLTLQPGALVRAATTGENSEGGRIEMLSEQGRIGLRSGATVATPGVARDGDVLLRAARTGTGTGTAQDVRIDALAAAFERVRALRVEAVQRYDNVTVISSTTVNASAPVPVPTAPPLPAQRAGDTVDDLLAIDRARVQSTSTQSTAAPGNGLTTIGRLPPAPATSPSTAPTPAPTPAPTASPTPAPTPAPTAAPTPAPTPAPTASPTPAPTPAPTASPTPAPTPAPTASPTPAPTPAPTASPTPAPTPAPTASPTPAPTPAPTASPTPAPTASPTPAPTPAPTASPTPAPTPAPTASPTPAPTPAPTASPTPAPTPAPTASPTPAPTPAPTASPTPAPTPAPTASPTPAPTPAPTASPTPAPTPAPTASPTPAPTPAPTASPTPAPTPRPGLLLQSTVNADNNRFMANESAVGARLTTGQPALAPVVQVAPGVEVRSTGAMRLNDDWRLPDATQRTGAAAMTLTLRAAGDLTLGQSLSDGFSASSTPTTSAVLPGAGANFRLTGGADLGAADPRSTARSTAQGDVLIGRAAASPSAQPPAVLVRSTTGQIEVAAARDLRLLNNAVQIYTTGRAINSATLPEFSRLGLAPNQSLRDSAGNAVGPFFTDAGGITLSAGRDVLGSPTRQYVSDWWWRQTGVTTPGAPAAWWSRYDRFQQGVASFGGGDIAVRAGRDVIDFEASTPASGYSIRAVTGSDGRPLPAAAFTLPGGELSVVAGRDIVSGLLYGGGRSARATAGAEIRPAANTGLGQSHPGLQLFYGSTDWTLQATGALTLGHLSNPALLAGVVQASGQARVDVITGLDNGAALTANSTASDVFWSGRRTALSPPTDPRNTVSDLARQAPGDLRLQAPAGNVRVAIPILQRPADDGRLQVLADGDVALSTVTVGAASLAGEAQPQVRLTAEAALVRDWARTTQAEPGLDVGRRDPVRVVAQSGDLTLSADVRSARPLRAVAGGDLLGTGSAALSVQHQAPGELTLLQAGRDVVLADNSAARVRLSGPGDLLVLAGRDVDLQGAAGLISNGNQDNPRLLPEGGARITVVSGVDWNGADYRAAVAAGLPLKGGGAGLVALEGELWAALQALDAGQALPTVGSSALQRAADQWRALGAAERTQRARQRVGEATWASGLREAIRRSEGQPKPAADESAPERALAEARAAATYDALDAARQAEIAAALQADLLAQALQSRAGQADTVTGYVAAVYGTWAPETRALRLHDVLFAELRAAGRGAARLPAGAAREAAYQPGYDALAALYPGSARQAGDIRLSSSQVKTQQGGSIRLITPGGGIDAGSLAGSTTKRASDLGVLTTAGGAIEAAVRDSFAVNQSRVFTLARGDLLIWSSTGNIDAGRGAKTVTGAPPPVFTIDRDGNVVVDTSGSFSGSGIAVLDANSALDLYAPQGEIAAGEAGIASRGTTFIASQALRGNDFTLSAGAVGAPAKADTGGATAGLSNLGQQASAATARAEPTAEEEDERKRRRQRRSLLLDFLGFGPGA